MRLVFAGTPEFAEQALAALRAAGHDVALVITQPDRPAGRGQQLAHSAVKQYSMRHGLPLYQPESLRDATVFARIGDAKADALIVAAYGALLPSALLDIGRFGALNIHASLLPRWRGAAPIQRALLAGDRETGVSIMRMEAGLDTGPVLAQRRIEIDSGDDAGMLHDKLAAVGAQLMVDTLLELESGRAHAQPQLNAGVTYAHKITKADTVLDWSRPAIELERAVRAFRPSPGASFVYEGESVKIWRARVTPAQGSPGRILSGEGRLAVACGNGALEIEELQRPGARRMSTAEFLRGRPGSRGSRPG